MVTEGLVVDAQFLVNYVKRLGHDAMTCYHLFDHNLAPQRLNQPI